MSINGASKEANCNVLNSYGSKNNINGDIAVNDNGT